MLLNQKYFPVILIPVIISCAAPKLTNNDRGRYKFETIDDPSNILEVSVYSIPLPAIPAAPKEKARTFFDLRDSIPNTFLNVIGQKAQNTQQIIDAIKAPLSVTEKDEKKTESTETDKNEIKTRLLFSNIKKYYNNKGLLHPNTRLEFLNTTVNILSPFAYIYSIDRLENEFERIDMGTLERTKDVSFNSKLSGEASSSLNIDNTSSVDNTNSSEAGTSDVKNVYDDAGNLIGTISLSSGNNSGQTNTTSGKRSLSKKINAKGELQYANNENIKEALKLDYQRPKTSFSFNAKKLTVSQRGRPLSDISDNIFVTVTLKIDNSKLYLDTKQIIQFSGLFNDTNKSQPVDKIKMVEKYVQYVPCYSVSDIILDVDYEGAIRAVNNQKKGRNILEFDDKVTYYKFSKNENSNDTIRIDMAAHCHEVYKIVVRTEDDTTNYVLNRANYPYGGEVLIYDEHSPEDLLIWLKDLIDEGDKSKLQSSNAELFFLSSDGAKKIYFSKRVITDEEIAMLKKINYLGFETRRE